MAILEVENLTVSLAAKQRDLVGGVSFSVEEARCVGLVGESGCGKSLTCKALLGVLGPGLFPAGVVRFGGRNILDLDDRAMEGIRGTGVGMIVQNAMAAFNPLFRIGPQMVETLRVHLPLGAAEAKDAALAALARTGLSDPAGAMAKYPHQLSGGMAQRIMIGLTLALRPKVLVADEPTSALDSVAQDEIVRLLAGMKQVGGMAMVFVSHNLAVVKRLADYIIVLREGRVVEHGPAREVFERPRHWHTRSLVAAHKTLGGAFVDIMTPRKAM